MRLIDADAERDGFMERIYDLLSDDPDNIRANLIIDYYDSLPTVELSVRDWIPCSERLPDESFEGLEWIRDEDGNTIACDVLVTHVSKSENDKRYVVDAMYFPGMSLSEGFTVDNVVAWQPLPEPYR